MRACARFLVVVALWWASPAAAQPADPIGALLLRMEQVLASGGNPGTVGPLFAADAEASQVDTLSGESAREQTTRSSASAIGRRSRAAARASSSMS